MMTFKHITNGSTMTYKDGCMQIDNLVIEGTPNLNYWEEVIEKDYEILSFYAKNISGKGDNFVDKDYIWYETSKGNGKWSRKGHITTPYNTQEIINHNRYGIHSVKRLSDGEIFTIGDRVRISKLQHDGSFIIDRFYFDCNNDKLLCNGKCTGNGHVSITKIEKVKSKVLFRSEDGVDIYEGDTIQVFYLHRINDYKVKETVKKEVKSSSFSNNMYYFSTKGAAEKYILLNKPCLSIQDVIDTGATYVELKKIVKERLWKS